MPVTYSPLRYPGGKTQLTPFVLDLLRANGLLRGVYAEPFAGGAGIAWRLLLNGDAAEVWLNDIDPAIYAFWYAVVHEPDPLCERIIKTEITMTEWERQRIVLKDSNSNTQDLAFATLFLNRTNRSGIIKGGVIGGKAQNGNYKLDCRFNREDLIRKIQRIHVYRDAIKLTRLDAENCLQEWDKTLPKKSLINIDPPYYAQGRDLYLSFYHPEDHTRLAKLIRSLNCKWMLTYDDTPEIEKLYKGLPSYRKGLTYYAQVKRKASEFLVLSKKLIAPAELLHSSSTSLKQNFELFSPEIFLGAQENINQELVSELS
ncbi:DNA adenine methylase [Acidovorax sp. Be4]|uniref:site-specific DNA-methyltransferase (adenine-specific) n=1 Tax=Acidovorax bellezanensis TaxID=2976702 RepID=A0ABT2PSZ6_9BURK|nr:DNA adenine methylase [Acidovorax sp. Be4]MCT9812402.1 DNA adenine methylase [Acidovorax sp. Be4]